MLHVQVALANVKICLLDCIFYYWLCRSGEREGVFWESTSVMWSYSVSLSDCLYLCISQFVERLTAQIYLRLSSRYLCTGNTGFTLWNTSALIVLSHNDCGVRTLIMEQSPLYYEVLRAPSCYKSLCTFLPLVSPLWTSLWRKKNGSTLPKGPNKAWKYEFQVSMATHWVFLDMSIFPVILGPKPTFSRKPRRNQNGRKIKDSDIQVLYKRCRPAKPKSSVAT